MIYVKLTTENEIDYIHYMPFDPEHGLNKTQVELEAEGKLLETLPIPEENGKIPVLKYDATTDSFYYEYTIRQLTPEEEVQQLKDKQALMQQAIDDLIFGGAL